MHLTFEKIQTLWSPPSIPCPANCIYICCFTSYQSIVVSWLSSCVSHFAKDDVKVNPYICRNRCRMHGYIMLFINALAIWKIYKLNEALLVFPGWQSLFTCSCSQIISKRWLLVQIHVPCNLQKALLIVNQFIYTNWCIMDAYHC